MRKTFVVGKLNRVSAQIVLVAAAPALCSTPARALSELLRTRTRV